MKPPENLPTRRAKRSRQHGVSLLEVIAYLGVAATIIVGAVALLSNAFSSARTNRAQEELAAIGTGVKRLFMSQGGAYGNGSMNAQLAVAGVFPSTLKVSGSHVSNAWNGAVTVTGNNSVFEISYGELPQAVCVELLATSHQFVSVSANGSAALQPPVTLAQATAQCGAESNTVVWTAR
jgi:hypothetical protein